MFFRIKKIKDKEYAYLVENKWTNNGVKQRVIAYLGRAYRFQQKNEIDFYQFIRLDNIDDYVNNNIKNKIIYDLIEWEILKHDINTHDFSLDVDNARILKNSKNIVILINNGFMCDVTLRSLLQFKAEGDEQSDGYRLARTFVEAGIRIPQEVFIKFFSKISNSKSI